MAKAEPLEDFGAAAAHCVGPFVPELHRHLDVFVRGQRVEQIMHLKDETDVAPHLDQAVRRQPRQIAAEDFDRALAAPSASAPIRVNRVVLPAPEGPVITTSSPGGTSIRLSKST